MHRCMVIALRALLFVYWVLCEDDGDLPHVQMEDVSLGNTTASDNISELTGGHANNATANAADYENRFTLHNNTQKEDDDLSWLEDAIRDVAYYLRSYKFNEYDRRYHNKKKRYYAAFPRPPLRSLHWEVKKYCELSFVHCVKYLNKKAQDVGLRRVDDTTYVILTQHWTNRGKYKAQIESVEKECRKMKQTDDILANPFEGPLERFQWRTTASYYMCW